MKHDSAGIIGAGFAGKRSATATSGPGIRLMVEFLNLAVMAEVPVVIFDSQRGGPSTGQPTKPEQGDLLTACFGSHGDAPKVVMAVSDIEDCFYAARAQIAHDQAIDEDRYAGRESAIGHDTRQFQSNLTRWEEQNRQVSLFNECMAQKDYSPRPAETEQQ